MFIGLKPDFKYSDWPDLTAVPCKRWRWRHCWDVLVCLGQSTDTTSTRHYIPPGFFPPSIKFISSLPTVIFPFIMSIRIYRYTKLRWLWINMTQASWNTDHLLLLMYIECQYFVCRCLARNSLYLCRGVCRW